MRLDALICWRFDPFASLHRGIEAREQQLPPRSHHPLWELVEELPDEKIAACRALCEGAERASWSREVAASCWNDKVSCSEALSYDVLAREVELRSRPLRERWLGFAPGACRWLERALGEGSQASFAQGAGSGEAASGADPASRFDLVPILPHQGGGGGPRWQARPALEFEAVLYDIDARCPEWLRWLRGALTWQLVARGLTSSGNIASQTPGARWRAAWDAAGPVADVLTVGAAAWVEVMAFDENTVLGLSRVTRRDAYGTELSESGEAGEAEMRRLLAEIDEVALQRPESLAGWIDDHIRHRMQQAG